MKRVKTGREVCMFSLELLIDSEDRKLFERELSEFVNGLRAMWDDADEELSVEYSTHPEIDFVEDDA